MSVCPCGWWAGEERALLAFPLIYRSRCQVSGSQLCGTLYQVLLPQAVLHHLIIGTPPGWAGSRCSCCPLLLQRDLSDPEPGVAMPEALSWTPARSSEHSRGCHAYPKGTTRCPGVSPGPGHKCLWGLEPAQKTLTHTHTQSTDGRCPWVCGLPEFPTLAAHQCQLGADNNKTINVHAHPRLSYSNSLQVGFQAGEGNGTPLQYSCLENPMDRGAW